MNSTSIALARESLDFAFNRIVDEMLIFRVLSTCSRLMSLLTLVDCCDIVLSCVWTELG
jgi:hypothetical protein